MLQCEDCKTKHASYGLPAEGGKKRWCAGCAQTHAGSVNGLALGTRAACEDCG